MKMRKSFSVVRLQETESKVFNFAVSCRKLNFPVTRDFICLRAEMLRDEILTDDTVSHEVSAKFQKF